MREEFSPTSPEETPVELKENIPHTDAQQNIPSSQLNNKATSNVQDEIKPSDSVSNIESRRGKQSSSAQTPEYQLHHLHVSRLRLN